MATKGAAGGDAATRSPGPYIYGTAKNYVGGQWVDPGASRHRPVFAKARPAG